MKRLVYILPVHNEERVLAAHVERLSAYLARFPSSSVLLVENGSRDDSWRVSEEAAAPDAPVRVIPFREEAAGLGYAYHRGLTEAIRLHEGDLENTWAVLTAADLPFGFSDLEAALIDMTRSSSRILMGSKAHPDSVIEVSSKRRVMTLVYRAARKVLLGMRVGDSQGSVFLRLDLAKELVPLIVSRDFFYTTELCYFAERAGEVIIELPAVTEGSEGAKRASTVKPWRDGTRMAKQVWQLRKRAGTP